ncbi:MAG: hypothetical protein ABIK28_21945 [Planctomycetota bacterium]
MGDLPTQRLILFAAPDFEFNPIPCLETMMQREMNMKSTFNACAFILPFTAPPPVAGRDGGDLFAMEGNSDFNRARRIRGTAGP